MATNPSGLGGKAAEKVGPPNDALVSKMPTTIAFPAESKANDILRELVPAQPAKDRAYPRSFFTAINSSWNRQFEYPPLQRGGRSNRTFSGGDDRSLTLDVRMVAGPNPAAPTDLISDELKSRTGVYSPGHGPHRHRLMMAAVVPFDLRKLGKLSYVIILAFVVT